MESVAPDPLAPRRPGSPPHNLPLELTSFIGRDREVGEIGRLLAERRLLTLCGTGGSGKTRLALAVAQDLVEEFEDGVWWVELAPVSDPKLVVRVAASALGAPEASDLSPTEALVEHLKGRKALLILDNCEHLVEECADLADTLLRTCPGLRILATSREPCAWPANTAGRCPASPYRTPGACPHSESWLASRPFTYSSSGPGLWMLASS